MPTKQTPRPSAASEWRLKQASGIWARLRRLVTYSACNRAARVAAISAVQKSKPWAARNGIGNGGGRGPLVSAQDAFSIALTPVLGEIDKLYKGGQAT